MRRLIVLVAGLMAVSSTAWAQAFPDTDGLGPRKVSPKQVMCTDLPAIMPTSATLRIVGGQVGDLRQSFAENDVVVLPGGTTNNLAVGQRFLIRRIQGGAYEDAMRRAGYYAVRTAGSLTVIGADENFALAKVDFSCDEVVTGDYLEPYAEPTLPWPIDKAGIDFDDRARVLFGTDRREMFGDGDLFSFDRGSDQGIVPGARMVVFRDRHIGSPVLPLVAMADCVVVEVSATTSKAVVVKMHGDVVQTGDVVVRRK